MTRSRRHLHSGLALIALALALPACSGGDPNATATVPAEGTVTYQGKPLEKGTIEFIPEQGRPASGTIQNGHFTLTTNTQGDGVQPGPSKVTVTAFEEVAATKPGQEATSKSLFPPNYKGNSGIPVEIPAGGKKDIAIELK
jgi:hypothetical protein